MARVYQTETRLHHPMRLPSLSSCLNIPVRIRKQAFDATLSYLCNGSVNLFDIDKFCA